MPKNIIICEAYSTGLIYVDEAIKRGYEPIVIFSNDADVAEDIATINGRKKCIDLIGNKAKIIMSSGVYEDILKELSGFDVECVIAGSEDGVRLADLLAKHFNVRGNDPETTWRRRTKAGMQQSLKEAGLRYIKSQFVKNPAEIEKFWKDNDLSVCVIKLNESAASLGLEICDSLDVAVSYFEDSVKRWNKKIIETQDVLIQEFIGGTEYIVNTVSRDGVHKVTDIWVYRKVKSRTGNMLYDYATLIIEPTPGINDLVMYTYRVLDAVGLENGPCHTELKIDKKGPVLIETNPRPMGGGLSREFIDECLGHHFTDVSLDAFLEPRRFEDYLKKPYRPLKSAMLKILRIPYEIDADIGPGIEFVKHLRSFRGYQLNGESEKQKYPKTVDLETSPLTVFMCNRDPLVLMSDNNLIDMGQGWYRDLLFSYEDEIEAIPPRTDIDGILKSLSVDKRYLVYTNDEKYSYSNGVKTKIDMNELDIYDGLIFALSEKMSIKKRIHELFVYMSQIRGGGQLIVVPEAYEAMPYKADSIEFVMNVIGISLNIPDVNSCGNLYGTKN